MSESNYRTALNHQLQLDETKTLLNHCKARRRQSTRRINNALRRMVLTVAVDAALIGASLTACVVLVACVIF